MQKSSQDSSVNNNKLLLYHIFCRRGIQSGPAGCFWAGVSREAAVKTLAWAAAGSLTSASRSAPTETSVTALTGECWLLTAGLGLFPLCCSSGFMTLAVGCPQREQDRKSKIEVVIYFMALPQKLHAVISALFFVSQAKMNSVWEGTTQWQEF